ncbi:MAG: hypothetical protein ACOCQG_04040 [Candidatus Nanoarchaeia archaeon]
MKIAELNSKKSQVAQEFVILFVIALAVCTFLIAILSNYPKEVRDTQEMTSIDQYAKNLQSEFITASQINDGYVRKIYIPERINGFEYSIDNTKSSMTLTSNRLELDFYYEIPEIEGDMDKGINKITKKEGVVHIEHIQ